MRRLTGCALLALGALFGSSCRRGTRELPLIDDESKPPLAVVSFADRGAERQLLYGFHFIENDAWRWTKGKFAVVLGAPKDASVNGARLELDLTVPESILARRKTVTLTGWVNETPLPPAVYSSTGKARYMADVPPKAFAESPVKVTFAVDGFLRAGEVDVRELGVIVSRAALLPK